jgi:hypothetical protein
LEEQKIALHPAMHLTDPLGYLDFLGLMSNSSVILTDSGGIQEETTARGIPCLTLRDNTERPITIEDGTNIIAGTGGTKCSPRVGLIPKFWDGHAAARCVEVLRKILLPSRERMTGTAFKTSRARFSTACQVHPVYDPTTRLVISWSHAAQRAEPGLWSRPGPARDRVCRRFPKDPSMSPKEWELGFLFWILQFPFANDGY